MSTTTAEAPPRPAHTVSPSPTTGEALAYVELPGVSWAAVGFYNHLRQVLTTGARLSKADLLGLLRTTSAAVYKSICAELHTAGVLTTLTTAGGGRVIVFTDPDHLDAEHLDLLTAGDEITKSRTSASEPPAIKYIPKGCTSPITSSTSLHPDENEKAAAQPHRPAQPARPRPARHGGDTAGQDGFSTGGDNPGDNRKKGRVDYSTFGWAVVNTVQREDPWLPVKPKRGKQIGYTIRMMVEQFGMAPEAARDLLIARALDSQTVAKDAIEAALTAGQTAIPVAPSPSKADAPAPVDLVDRTGAHEDLEATLAAAKIPDGIASGIRSLVMERSELLRRSNFAVHFAREARQAGIELNLGQWWQAAQLMAEEPGWDYGRIAGAMATVAARG